jgi:hypothetical protein
LKTAFIMLTIVVCHQPCKHARGTGVVQENGQEFQGAIKMEAAADLLSCPTSRLALSSRSVCTHARTHERRDKTLKKNGVDARRCS